MIRLNKISFAYGSQTEPILSNVSLQFKPGESVAIMGPNGSGKSTLARIIAGLIKPISGEVVIDSANRSVSEIGFLFQNPDNQMVAMTVAKEVAFALENRAIPVNEMRALVDAMLSKMGIADLADRLTSELSGGEKQRVALAASIICHPPILILDEPDSFLDTDGRHRLSQNLTALKSDNPNLIIIRITQYERVAREYPRLILLDQGTILADGAPAQILAERADSESEPPANIDISLLQNNKLPASSNPVKIVLDKVQFGYSGSKPVCDCLSVSLKQGETVGLFGPTGSGKSSLGQMLCGLLPLTSGSMTLHMEDGRITERTPPGSIAGVMQMPERQFFLPTCAEEIAFGPKNHSKPFSDIQIDQFFRLVGLDPERFAERDPLSLSVGEKRRLAFAAILSMSPSFVIFDEPTASLDAEGVRRFISLSENLRQIGLGQVIISHEKEIITRLTDRAWCLPGDGSLIEIPDSRQIEDQNLIQFLAD